MSERWTSFLSFFVCLVAGTCLLVLALSWALPTTSYNTKAPCVERSHKDAFTLHKDPVQLFCPVKP